VKTYLRPEFCEHPERGCPLAALAPELARADKGMKPQIVAELVNYKNQMLPFMPGRRTADIKTTWSKSRLFVHLVLSLAHRHW
jgi:TetR/AcrR family transcriptional repressor of nem operon